MSSRAAEHASVLTSRLAGWLLVLAVVFNAFLAILNALGKTISDTQVMGCEVFILLLSSVLIATNVKKLDKLTPPVLFFYATILIFIWISLFNNMLFIKALRDIGLMVIFLLLGGLIREKQLIRTFQIIALLTIVFIIQEAWFTDSYANLFQPASYYANTRGVAKLTSDSSGLFRNSLGYKGRFTFGLSEHRLSSIFLEQVSLSNFSMILAIFTSCFWSGMGKFSRLLMVSTVILMVLGTSSRTATQLCLVIFFGHFIFPRLPRYSHALYMPVFLILVAVLFYDPHFVPNDDMSGRLGNTVDLLSKLDMSTLFIGDPKDAGDTADSGYTYLVYTQSMIGLILFWLFTTLILPSNTPGEKRFAHGASIYIAVNLLIGAAIFSIKVSAPLWLVAGFFYRQQRAIQPEPRHAGT